MTAAEVVVIVPWYKKWYVWLAAGAVTGFVIAKSKRGIKALLFFRMQENLHAAFPYASVSTFGVYLCSESKLIPV